MSRERVLVVDDSADNREFIVSAILKPNQYEPLEARDGVECMEIARKESPDLILLDLQMPRLDGLGVLDALRRENLAIPVILMTFHGSEEIAVEVFRKGVRDYVKKPYTPEEMLRAIEGSLTETRLRREKEALTGRLLAANKDLHARVKELNTIYTIGKSVTALLDPAQLLARVVEAAVVVTGAEGGSLILAEEGDLILRAVKRRGEAHARPTAEITQDRIAERAIQSGEIVSLTPQQMTLMKSRNPNAPHAVMFVPIKLSGRTIGVVGVENITVAKAFSEHEGALVSALGDYAAIAIENARNFQALEEAKEREQMQIRRAFERYAAPSVVDRILRAPDGLTLGGQRREVSILFADLRGYTNFTQQAAPESVVELLNAYMTLAAEVIFAREGTLDNYLGSTIMAIFNAPEEQSDHLYRAVDAAIALQHAIQEMNAKHKISLALGIGVAVGEAIIGNVGTQRAMHYTALGGVVGTAKRLQERAAAGQTLAEEEVITRLGDLLEAERLGATGGTSEQGQVGQAVVYLIKGLA
ncbi:MAG TPA: adenylate/guanylate cyclase domain-containing protein [Aggregatilineales bacterium]|nr:response regulator [Anaerolineales bacterium]HRE49320.1 adenylate/guanylate cyclase domain-containing protein [Aggregatilineales bacterium]